MTNFSCKYLIEIGSILKKYISNYQNYSLYLCIFLTSLFGAQRYLLESTYIYVCIFPLIISIFYFHKEKSLSLIFLIISLFLSVDNGVGVYGETPSHIRYFIYFWGIFLIFQRASICQIKLFIYLLLMFPPIIMSMINSEDLILNILTRDIFAFTVIGLAISQVKNEKNNLLIEWKYLAFFFVLFLFFEVINCLFFYLNNNFLLVNHYLSYDSVKAFSAFSLFYYLQKKNYLIATIVGLMTIFVFINYGSRLPLLMLMLISMLALISLNVGRSAIKFFLSFVFLLLVFYLLFILNKDTKFGSLFSNLLISEGFIDWIRLVDPIRYYENVLFFDRDILSVLFGNGFGSSLNDTNGYLNFVQLNQTAFSSDELNSGIFYNFHDFWVDFGLRFGLLNCIFLIYLVTRRYLTGFNNSFVNTSLLILIFTSFFSSPGILLIAIFLMISSENAS
jgi:hypothetical protein